MYHVVFIFRRLFLIILTMMLEDEPDYQLMFHISSTLLMIMYIGQVQPFAKWEFNVSEMVNEYTTLILGVF